MNPLIGSNAMKKFVLLLVTLLLVGTGMARPEEKAQGQPFLGITISSLSDEELKDLKLEFGIRVVSVLKGEPADKAGIEKGDVIQSLGGQKIGDPRDVSDKISDAKPGDQVKIKLIRDGKSKEVTATLGERKQEEGYLFRKGIDIPTFKAKPRYYIGVSLLELGDDLASYFSVKKDDGVLVISIEEKGPAEKAGLKAGDVIVKVNGQKTKDSEAVREALAETKDNKAEIALIRHGKSLTVSAEPEKRRGFSVLDYFIDEPHAMRRFRVPSFHISPPLDAEHWEIWSDEGGRKIEAKLKVTEEKLKQVEEKLKEKAETIKKKKVMKTIFSI